MNLNKTNDHHQNKNQKMKNIIAFAALLVAILTCSARLLAQKPLFTAPLGIEAYTFRKSFPINTATTLDTIKLLGFTELEGGSENISPQEFKKLCDERGISIPSTGASYDELVKHPDSVVYNAKILGAKYVMCAWIPHDEGVLTFENAKKAAADFNKAGKFLKEHGLVFCYHAHGYEFQPYEKGTLLDYIFHNTDPKYVSFEMDIFWIQFGGGDPVELLKKYGSRWKLMHLKDMRKGTKKDLTGLTSQENDVPIGTGEIDIPGVLKQAKKTGIKHYFIEDESINPNWQVPQSISYLKSLKE
jgi:sugar phosphate isomerase/epimerase